MISSVPTEKGETMAEYIERSAAKRMFQNIDAGAKEHTTLLAPYEFAELLDEIPAADVAPVVHGEWIGKECSVCKLPVDYCMVENAQDWGYFDPMPDYCPNCGAKMDLEAAE